jgi:hypothetical protein
MSPPGTNGAAALVLCSSRNVLVLESLLDKEEHSLFPLVWRGEWTSFMRTFMVGEFYGGILQLRKNVTKA